MIDLSRKCIKLYYDRNERDREREKRVRYMCKYNYLKIWSEVAITSPRIGAEVNRNHIAVPLESIVKGVGWQSLQPISI